MPSFLQRISARKFSSAASTAVDVGVNGETQARLVVDAGGKLTWGSGSVAGDVTLYRDSANVLKTDDTFNAPALIVDSIEIDTTGATTNQVLAYNGTKFLPTTSSGGGGGTTVSDTPPSSPTTGQLWFESDTGKLFSYYDSAWVEVSGSDGATGPAGPAGSGGADLYTWSIYR